MPEELPIDYIERFGRYMEAERRCSPLTLQTYTQDLRQFAGYLAEGESEEFVFDPAAVVLSDIRSWIIRLSEQKVAVGSINRKITTLRSFYRYLMRQGVVEANPLRRIKALRSGRRLPHFVEEDRMERLTAILEEPSKEYEIERDAVILLLLYACGLRRSELASLQTDSVDLSNGVVKVMGKGAKERLVPLLPGIVQRLEYYLQLRNQQQACENGINSLFLTSQGKAVTPQGVYYIVRKYLSAAGVQGKQSPHVLRHTFATHLMQHGVSVRTIQRLLGHETLAATQIYTHNTIESLRESYRRAHPRARGTEGEK